MRILWIVNTIFPEPSKALGIDIPVVGGWMYGLAEQLNKTEGITLSVATTYAGTKMQKLTIGDVDYFLLPSKNKLKYESHLEEYWVKILSDCNADVIHIHGTEYAHGLACLRALPRLKYVISIQGLVGVCSQYYFSGIGVKDVLRNITFRDIIRWDTLFHQKRNFKKRGLFEKEYIQQAKNVIGRTSWDYAHTKTILPKLNYHFCNESLRVGFYTSKKWSLEECEPYTLFLSQAGYPIKGLHQVLKAVALVSNYFPLIKVKIGGSNVTASSTFKEKIRISGYGNYIKRLITKLDLVKQVTFLGNLSEEEMVHQYRKANVFVCPSSIENSPNSLGEAQLIGVPCIAAYVGGVPDMIEHDKTGLLYRFEEVEMLAQQLIRVFADSELALKLSVKGIEAADFRHDSKKNLEATIAIYSIINE